jgi:hypothetical protein
MKRVKVSATDLRQEIEELRHVGAQMANVFFNWSQGQQVIDSDEREMMASLYRQWDSVKRRGFRRTDLEAL